MSRPKPVTSCTACGRPGHYIELGNDRCGHMVGGKQCKGTNQSATQQNDWIKCAECHAEGYTGISQCHLCPEKKKSGAAPIRPVLLAEATPIWRVTQLHGVYKSGDVGQVAYDKGIIQELCTRDGFGHPSL